MNALTYKNVLHSKFAWLGHIGELFILAQKLNYPYFLWNDRVYDSKAGVDTGKTIEDITQ